MISAENIRVLAGQLGIAPGILEKDYVLSKVLSVLSSQSLARETFVFKGGTALKKFYFTEWRYSEDLDFTSRRRLTRKEVSELFAQACDATAHEFGLPIRVIEYSQYPRNEDEPTSAQFKLGYDGPLHRTSGQKNNIRVDVAFDEPLVDTPSQRDLLPFYSDDSQVSFSVYSLEEIVAEKLRSILQRGKSRDYYDVWVLLKDYKTRFSADRTRAILKKKCEHKGLPFPTVDSFFEPERTDEAARYWERGLAHQMTDLPSFDTMLAELRLLLHQFTPNTHA